MHGNITCQGWAENKQVLNWFVQNCEFELISCILEVASFLEDVQSNGYGSSDTMWRLLTGSQLATT